MSLRRLAGLTTVAVLAATGLAGCSSGNSEDTITIGSTDADLQEWSTFEQIAEENGLDVEIVPFSDYNTPNPALDSGQLDLNKFQHLAFLAEYNVGADSDLVPIASAEIYPLALFWDGHTSLDGIEGQSIAIPNDPSNQGRAINLLADNGLLTLHSEAGLTPTPADIDTEASLVSVTPIEATQTSSVYNTGQPAVVNNSFMEKAGMNPADALLQDDPNSDSAAPYINVWVTTADKADDPRLAQVTELWKDPAVTEAINQTSKGTAVPIDRDAQELQEILDRLEADLAEEQ